jgi:SAM-dependent methyltransferase
LTDIETCYKAVKTDLLKTIPIESNDFRIEPELTIKLAKRRAKIFEVPISYSGRTYEEGKKIGWKDGFKALWSIIKFGFSDNIFTHDSYGAKIIFRLSKARKFNNWMSETISPYVGQNILEIGAGIGNLTAAFLPRKSYNATDVNPLYLKMFNRLKENSPFLKTAYLDLNDVSTFQRLGKRFDTVICLNVLEHIEDDQAALRNIACLLDPGGMAVVLVPQGQWLYGSLDRVLGHVKRYSQKELEYLSDQTGFDCNKMIEFNRVSSLPWFLNGRVFKTKTFSKFQMIMLEFFVPLFKVIDKFLPWPSTSLIAILTKK